MSWQSSFCAHSKVREHRRKHQHYVITPPSLIQHHATPPTLPNFSFVATFPSPSKNASPIVSTSSSRVMGTASVTGPLLYDNVREGIRYIVLPPHAASFCMHVHVRLLSLRASLVLGKEYVLRRHVRVVDVENAGPPSRGSLVIVIPSEEKREEVCLSLFRREM